MNNLLVIYVTRVALLHSYTLGFDSENIVNVASEIYVKLPIKSLIYRRSTIIDEFAILCQIQKSHPLRRVMKTEAFPPNLFLIVTQLLISFRHYILALSTL